MFPNSSAGVNRSVGLFRFGDCSSGEQAARQWHGAGSKGGGRAVLDAGRAEGEAQAAGCRGTGMASGQPAEIDEGFSEGLSISIWA